MQLDEMLQLCRDRPRRRWRQVQTEVLPAGYNNNRYHFQVHYAHNQSAFLHDFEKAHISFLPIGREPFDRAPNEWDFAEAPFNRISTRQITKNWRPRRWYHSWGLGIYTGIQSGHEQANWHDIEFTHDAILDASDAVSICLQALRVAVVDPLITLTKEGGLRFSCRVRKYLHPHSEKDYIYTTHADLQHRKVYTYIKGERDYSIWDARYEVIEGSVFNPPTISQDALFASMRLLKSGLHRPMPQSATISAISVPQKPPENRQLYNTPHINELESPDFEKINAIRAGKLSPLSIKRPEPVIEKQPTSEPDTLETILESDARVIGISTGLHHPDTFREIESAFLKEHPLLLSLPTLDYCITADKHHTANGASIGTFQQPDHLDYAIKNVPFDELLKNPFGRGNLCIDSERYQQIHFKGGLPHEILCPRCPVVDECYDDGFHAQFRSIPESDVCIAEHKTQHILFDPTWHKNAEIFTKGSDRICIHNTTYVSDMFVENSDLTLNLLNEWAEHWKHSTLGDFALHLLNAIQINESEKTGDLVSRVRGVLRLFQEDADILNAQMCQVNVAVKGMVGSIGMPLKDAAAFGLFDISSIATIKTSQPVCHNPNWTFFHRLEHFFKHYTNDADAPMRVNDSVLCYYLPPKLHPHVKKLVILSPLIPEEYLKTAFSDEEVAVFDLGSKDIIAGNKVYQLRGDLNTPHLIINYDLDWDALGLSKLGIRYYLGVYNEIQNTPDTQYSILWQNNMVELATEIYEHPNTRTLYFVKNIADQERFLINRFDDADVVWSLGAPYRNPNETWNLAKVVLGNEAKPLDYTVNIREFVYQDERIQNLIRYHSISQLLGTLSYAGLAEGHKTLVLNNTLRLPGITDAPETQLFDWEDFEIAGSLENLDETIAQREVYEDRAAEIDETWMPYQIMPILGVDRKEANRYLRENFGRIGSVTAREEIIAVMKQGKSRLKDIAETMPDRRLTGIQDEIRRMWREGLINRVGWGLYELVEEDEETGNN